MAVGLDLELPVALADVFHHLEKQRVDHGFAARERDVGNFAIHRLGEEAEYLVLVQFIVERLARPAFLDAVEAREVALVRDLPGDVERRTEITRAGSSRSGRRDDNVGRTSRCLLAHRLVLQQPLLPQLRDVRERLAFDHALRVVEALLQSPNDGALVTARSDLAYYSRSSGVEREDLLGTGLEQHPPELFFAEFGVFVEFHGGTNPTTAHCIA